MKLLQLSLLIVASTTTVFAQGYTPYHEEYKPYRTVQNEIHEIRVFERELDQFSYALMIGDRITARESKRHIMDDMRREMRESKIRINELEREVELANRSYRQRSYSNSLRLRSRENGRSMGLREIQRELQKTIYRLEKQERLFIRFEDLSLTDRRGRLINENEHRRIMYEFKNTMREQLRETTR